MKKRKHTALFEWQEKCKDQNEKCAWCGTNQWLTVDHIVPAHLLKELEVDDFDARYDMDENFQLLCKQCNKFKSGHLELKNPKTYSILLRLLVKARDIYNPLQNRK